MAGFKAETATGVKGAFSGIAKMAGITLGAIGLAEGIKHSVAEASNFQAAMELVHTQAGATQGEVNKLTGSLQNLAPKLGIDTTDLANGLFRIESAGLRGADALKAVTLAGKGAQIGQANFEDVAKTLANILESGIVKGANAAQSAMSQLNAIVGAGDMRMQDLAEAMSTGILPVATSFGLSLRDVGAAIATMTATGVPATEAATRLRMTLSLMESPAGKARKVLAAIGIGATDLATDFHKPNGLIVALGDLKSHMEAAGLSSIQQSQLISQAFGGGRTSSGIITLLQRLDDVRHRSGQIAATAGNSGEAWTKTTETAAFQFKRFRASINEVAVSLGTALLPSLTRAAKQLADWVQRMQHSGKLQEDFNQIVGITSTVVRTVVGGVKIAASVFQHFSSIVGGLHNAVRILLVVLVASKFTGIARAVVGLGGAFVGLVGKIGTAVSANRAAAAKMAADQAEIAAAARASATETSAVWSGVAQAIRTEATSAAGTWDAAFFGITTKAKVAATEVSASFAGVATSAKVAATETVGALDAAMIAFAAEAETAAATSTGAFTGMFTAIKLGVASTAVSIKGALVSTGIGAIVIAIGFAVAYILTHWDKVKRYTVALGVTIKAIFFDVLKAVEGYYEFIGGSLATTLTLPLRGFLELASKVTGWLSFLPGVSSLHDKVGEALDFLKKGTTDLVTKGAHNVANGVTSIFGDAKKAWTKALADSGNDPTAKAAAKQSGQSLGKALADGAASSIAQSGPEMTKKLGDALQAAVKNAQKAISDSIVSAKQNLNQIGTDLASTIQQIQDKIAGATNASASSPQGQAFKRLKQLIESGAPSFEIQKAQAELSSQLQNVGKTQQGQGGKKGGDVSRQLADLAFELNKGTISYATFQERLHKILREHGVTMREALKAGGKAFAAEFEAQLRAFRAQAKAIADIPGKLRGIGGGGLTAINVIRPLETIRAQAEKVATAAQRLREAQLKQQEAIARAAKATAEHTRQMARELGRERHTRHLAQAEHNHPEIATSIADGVKRGIQAGIRQAAADAHHHAQTRGPHSHVHTHKHVHHHTHHIDKQSADAAARTARDAARQARGGVPTQPTPTGGGGGGTTTSRDPQRVTHAHLSTATQAIVRAIRRVCDDITSASKDIVTAETHTRTPIENLRRTEIRIADQASRERATQLRATHTTNTILRRMERHGRPPGFNKEPKGVGSHHARKASQAGVKV